MIWPGRMYWSICQRPSEARSSGVRAIEKIWNRAGSRGSIGVWVKDDKRA
jgi:hypothetical protein